MGKYSDIVNGSWVDMTLYAESIPHLLHWDLAYQWILEKDHLMPEAWEERVEAWRYLVSLLLVGELDIEDELINTPFLHNTQPYGIIKVSWVCLRNTQERIGVLSPTILVRPLPDFKNADLRQWKRTIQDPADNRPDELRHFAGLVVNNLREGQRGETPRTKLADILEHKFKPRPMNNPPRGGFQTVQLLNHLSWAQETDGPCVEDVDILIRRVAGGAQKAEHMAYIPVCERCAYPLMRVADAPAIVIEQQQFQVDCKNAECGHTNLLDLANFLMWIRNRNQVIVWDQQGVLTTLARGFPPTPTIQGPEALFEWGPAQVGTKGDRYRRFLRLNFPEKEITSHRLEELFYGQVLIPGDFEQFTGLPVRSQWLDALADPTAHMLDLDFSSQRITYRGLSIQGWPDPLTRPFVSLKRETAIAIGVYPDPQAMPDEWKLYRIFVTGESRRAYQLVVDTATEMLPWLCEKEDGPPQYLSVVDKKNPNVGVTYQQHRARKSLQGTPANVYVGVDFGTTNTIVYALLDPQSTPNPLSHGVKPTELHQGVGWVAGNESETEAPAIGDFLPGPTYGHDRPDQYIIPSALWALQPQQYVIRWSADNPSDTAKPQSDFKLDRTKGEHYKKRKAFLQELLWLVLPNIIREHAPDVPARFHIGFAFPLAFDYDARQDMVRLIGELGARLSNPAYSFEFYTTDESHACVRAFGRPNPDDIFLVADMGGGTMDVALFVGRTVLLLDADEGRVRDAQDSILQIGSVQFAGQDFVKALVEKKHSEQGKREQLRWELRDLIIQGRCHERYGSDAAAQNILHRFTAMSFEFLRTMLAAQLRAQQGAINLVLVGNGWHFVEAFNSEPGRRDPKLVFEEFYHNLLDYFGYDSSSLCFYNLNAEFLHALPSSKHLVVIGALKNAIHQAAKRPGHTGQEKVSKLPAGRKIDIKLSDATNRTKAVRWYEMVGEGVPWKGLTEGELRDAEYNFDLSDMPPLTGDWLRYLLGVFKVQGQTEIPYPRQEALRELVVHHIQGNPPKLRKSPLQLILEGDWKERLKG